MLAEVVAPVLAGDKVILPMRTELIGYVKDARKVGLGFSRETAQLHLEFPRVKIPGQAEQDIAGRVTRVDDARETVDDQGRIRGIRATESFSSVLAGIAVSVSAFDPMALIFSLSSSLSIFRLPDSSIVLPAGSELKFTLTSNLPTGGPFASPYPALSAQGGDELVLQEAIKKLPFRTETQSDDTPSDLTSLLYLGSAQSIERAFAAAGWVRSDRLDGKSTYGVMRSIVENQGYRAAPMSVLTLNHKEPEYTLAKTLNTFFSRHHLRIYSQSETIQGLPVWTSTATYDSGIGFSRNAKTFIHLINENIDEERGKVVNDLVLTGCVDGVTFVERPWVPRDAKNATGDTLRTDGRIAVLRLNECERPVRSDEEDIRKDDSRLRQSAFIRPVRSTFLTLRNDLIRGNIGYQGYHAGRMAWSVFRGTRASATEDTPKSFRYGGQEFLIVDGSKPVKHPEVPKDAGHELKHDKQITRPKSYAHRLSFSLSGGLNGFGNSQFASQDLTLVVGTPAGTVVRDPFRFDNTFERGWMISPKVTLHSGRYWSNEFSYSRTTTNFRLFGGDQITNTTLDSRSKAAIRQFTYNLLLNATPNGKRVRPYLAIGPAFQLIHLLDSAPSENSALKLAARDIALLIGAYDFGSKPVLQGGGVFQFGLNYGGGVAVYVTRNVFLRGDFRETLSGQPDVWKGSTEDLARGVQTDNVRLELQPLIKHGPLRIQQVSLGIGISF